MRYLSMFSGMEAATLAWRQIGWTAAAFAEIEPFTCSLLAHHYPDVPNLGDVTRITREQVEALGHIDVVVFGFPCQDLSVAGQRKGLTDADGNATRSGLFFDAMRVAEWTKARWIVAENVPGLLSHGAGRTFAAVAGTMAGAIPDVPRCGWGNCGAVLGPAGLVEWSVLDAQWFGVAQRRERVFLVRDSGDWAGRPPVLLERESMCGNPPARRQAGADVAAGVAACLNSGGNNGGFRTELGEHLVVGALDTRIANTDDNTAQAGHLVPEVAGTLNANAKAAGSATQQDAENGLLIAHTLLCDGFDASEDRTGRGTPIIPIDMRQASRGERMTNNRREGSSGGAPGTGIGEPGDPCPSLAASHTPAIAYGFDPRQDPNSTLDVSEPLDCQQPGKAVAFQTRIARNGRGQPKDTVDCLTGATCGGHADTKPHVAYPTAAGYAVRRLTPTECERLQGAPDGHTAIPHRGKPAADGPRYRAIGNSMAVPVMRWIGRRIQEVTL